MTLMQTFDADISHFDPSNPYQGDERIPVQFYMGTVKDEDASASSGRPIFHDVPFIRIFNSKDNIIDRPIRDTDMKRWPRAYAAWKGTGESEPGATGTRLEHWPLMTRAQAEEFKYFKCYTIEQLADMPDSLGDKVMGFQRLKALAKMYVEAAKGEAPMIRVQAELEKRDGEIAELKSEVARLSKLMEAASAVLPAKAKATE